MLEDYDPYLTCFFRDIGTGISFVFQAVELFFGISYFVGGKIVEGVIWTATASTKGYKEIAAAAEIFRDEVTEFGASFLRAVLLIYYALFKVVESFYIVAVDIKNLYYHVTESLSRTIAQSSTCAAAFITGLFTEVPGQVIEALSMIGETSVVFLECVIAILKDFFMQILLSPVKVVLLILKSLAKLILLPINILYRMPPASILGLLVIIMFIFISRRLWRYIVVRNIRLFFTSLVSVLSRGLSLIRMDRIKNLIKSSVFTIVSTNDQRHFVADYSKPACVICQENPVTYMSNPCKHVCLCDVCVYGLLEHDNRCLLCRSRVTTYDRVFIP